MSTRGEPGVGPACDRGDRGQGISAGCRYQGFVGDYATSNSHSGGPSNADSRRVSLSGSDSRRIGFCCTNSRSRASSQGIG